MPNTADQEKALASHAENEPEASDIAADTEAADIIASVSVARVRTVIGELYSEQFDILLYLTFFYFFMVTIGDLVAVPNGAGILLGADILLLSMLVAIFFLERRGVINKSNVYITPIPIAISMLINGYLHMYFLPDPITLVKGILMIVAFGVVALLPWIFWLLLGLSMAFFITTAIWILGEDSKAMIVLGIGAGMISYGSFVMRYNSVRKQIALTLINEERAEKLATLGKAKDQFIANISHELRTPLTGLLGMVNLIDEHGLSEEQLEQLTAAKSSADTLGTIIGDLLDVSTIDAGKLELNIAPFDIEKTGQSVISVMQGQVKSDVALVYKMPPTALPVFMGDGARIRQILFNLVGNAVKFTDHGSVHLSISLLGPERSGKDDGPVTVRCLVEDTGVGIAADQVEKLFDRFEQVDASSTRGRSGTGLGLAIAQELAFLMNSRIEVESKIGVGTKFWFDIALERAPEEASNLVALSPSAINDATVEAMQDQPLRILIAEDNPVNQLLISRLLDRPQWKNRLVSDGMAAVDAAEESQFDIILMDIQMPIMNGETATAKIRSEGGPNAATPIIALTANCQESDIKRYREAGFAAHVGKPIVRADFYRTIASLVIK